MRKKLIGILIVLTLICTAVVSQVAFADGGDDDSYDVTNFDVVQSDIEKAAGAFLLSDVVNNSDSGWDNSSKNFKCDTTIRFG